MDELSVFMAAAGSEVNFRVDFLPIGLALSAGLLAAFETPWDGLGGSCIVPAELLVSADWGVWALIDPPAGRASKSTVNAVIRDLPKKLFGNCIDDFSVKILI